MIDQSIRQIIENLNISDDGDFFAKITQSLASVLQCQHLFIASLNQDCSVATTLAYAINGEIADNFEYELAGTPCENVFLKGVHLHNANLQDYYPGDQFLIENDIHSYVGTPLFNNLGDPIGIVVALYREKLESLEDVQTVFEVVSNLLTNELQRRTNQRELELKQNIIDSLSEAVILTDENRKILFTNPAFSIITGYSKEEAAGQKPENLLRSGLHSRAFYSEMKADIYQKGLWHGDILNRKKSGDVFTERQFIQAIKNNETGEHYFLSTFYDISELNDAKSRAYHHENFDTLTGLPKRQLLASMLEEKQLAKTGKGRSLSLTVGLDKFREVNLVHGYALGDAILQLASERLEEHTPDSSLVSRINGDEFFIFIDEIENEDHGESYLNRIIEAFRAPFIIDEKAIEVTVSIGVSLSLLRHKNIQDIISEADQALANAKSAGGNCYRYFTLGMQASEKRRVQLKGDLKEALKAKNIEAYFQPIINLKTEKIEKCEALARWHNDGEWVSPCEFITIAEEFNLAIELGNAVLEKTCEAIHEIDQQTGLSINYAVNRSAKEFPSAEDASWADSIEELGLAADRISFEITESMLTPENAFHQQYLMKQKDRGCTISLDDFGTGYSSLSYIRNFPIDYLKIDRSFVNDMTSNSDAFTLVSTIVAMAKSLKIQVIAEGVESLEQYTMLQDMGCNYVQGYFLSRPLPKSEFIHFLNAFDARRLSPETLLS